VAGVGLNFVHDCLAINLGPEPFQDDSPPLRNSRLADQIRADHIRNERQEQNMSVSVAHDQVESNMTVIENEGELPV